MKIPFVMHDCDANPGLVTRKLAPFARSLSVAFETAKDKLNNSRCFVNGNPIRTEFSRLTKDEARKNLNLEDKLTLCIMGGSQGAQTINNASVEILETLSKDLKLQIIFQTGKRNYDEVIQKLEGIYPEYKNDKNIIIRPYFNDMVKVLKASDIAVSRAGSLSISELCASSTAPVFIPYPYAAANHQRKNAEYMVKNGAGIYLEDADTNNESLLKILKELINDKNKLNEIRTGVEKLAIFDGVTRIVEQLQ